VLLLHPTTLINQEPWDLLYLKGNPKVLVPAKDRNWQEQRYQIKEFALFIERISSLKKTGLIEVTPPFKRSSKYLEPTQELVDKMYVDGVQWGIENFNYKPRFLYSHFLHFFNLK
jgi:hypothetical protein